VRLAAADAEGSLPQLEAAHKTAQQETRRKHARKRPAGPLAQPDLRELRSLPSGLLNYWLSSYPQEMSRLELSNPVPRGANEST
jgi:hypothetical protein